MSKLHTITGISCIICDEKENNMIELHKTRRQTHKICYDCTTGYFRPILEQITNNLRKNIKRDNYMIKCPGTYHSNNSNKCKKTINIKDICISDKHEIHIDLFRILYVLSTNEAYLCPNKKCGEILHIDYIYDGKRLECISCLESWCKECYYTPYHNNKSCLEVELEESKSDNAILISEMKKKGVLKLCPQCKAATIKNSGCNKMLCINCGIKWCWLCEKFTIDYDHFNEKSNNFCSNKLWENVKLN